MGVVVSARDPNLDRRVAIKLLKPDAYGRDDESQKAALVREAQTVARLEHANVVTVYEAGLDQDQVFVAMQFVDGGTLRDWLRSGARSVAEILDVHLNAGRGLAAAHAAGLVHRDFKPDNVLISNDGRVFVSDFGLAGRASSRHAELVATQEGHPIAATGDPAQLQATQTRTGSILGTPAYMAPEVWEGAELDPQSDQFAYCVSLWEALYGARPFTGQSIAELAGRVGQGRLPDPPAGTEVPAWVHQILVRGLAPRRSDRWPSMRVLLKRLERGDPARRWRRLAVVVGITGLLAGALGGAVVWFADAAEDPCAGGEVRVAAVWNEGVVDGISAAFVSTGLGYAPESFTKTETTMAAYADAWASAHRDTCEATHVRNEQSPEQLDLRMRCLDDRLAAFSSLTTQLGGADEATVDKSAQAAAALAPLSACDDVEALSSLIPPPSDPALAAEVAALRTRIADAAALEQLGRYTEGLEASTAIAADARGVDYSHVRAEALELHGRLLSRSGKGVEAEPVLRESLELAAECGDARLEARAWDRLLFAIGYMQTRHEEAMHLVPAARSAVKRAKDEDANGRLLLTIGTVQSVQGNNEEARATVLESIEILEGLHGPDSFVVAVSRNTLGSIEHGLGQLDQAAKTYADAIAAFEGSVGPHHPNVAAVRHNLGILEQTRADFDAARGHMEAALEIWRAAHGEDHPNVASGYENLGALEFVQGNYDEAAELYEKSFELRTKLLEPGDLMIASSHYNLATVAYARGNPTGALEHALKAHEIRLALLGPEHPEVAAVLEFVGMLQSGQGLYADAVETFALVTKTYLRSHGENHPVVARSLANQGDALLNDGRCEDAIPIFERSIEINEAALGMDHPDLAYALTGLGACHIQGQRVVSALAPLQRAYDLREKHPVSPLERGYTRFAFAKAAWSVGRQADARKAAGDAADDFRSLQTYGAQVAEIEAWIREH
jgi:tetratricopeptide (TPR) repeat protein